MIKCSHILLILGCFLHIFFFICITISFFLLLHLCLVFCCANICIKSLSKFCHFLKYFCCLSCLCSYIAYSNITLYLFLIFSECIWHSLLPSQLPLASCISPIFNISRDYFIFFSFLFYFKICLLALLLRLLNSVQSSL